MNDLCPQKNMNPFNVADFMLLRQHIKIVHHVPGRIRVKLMLSALKLPNIDPMILESFQYEAHGIKDVRINRTAGSAAITYDAQTIPLESCETIIHGEPELAEQTLLSLIDQQDLLYE